MGWKVLITIAPRKNWEFPRATPSRPWPSSASRPRKKIYRSNCRNAKRRATAKSFLKLFSKANSARANERNRELTLALLDHLQGPLAKLGRARDGFQGEFLPLDRGGNV